MVTLPNFSTSSSSTTTGTSSGASNTTTSARPTYTATEIYAFNPDAPIHLLPLQAAGLVFRLGGSPAAYCPSWVERVGGCSDTSVTTFNNCSLVSYWSSVVLIVKANHVQTTWVPGGQSVYLAPDGSLRYTQPHSQYIIPGSLICPLSFTEVRDSDASKVLVAGFGSTGFMACPMLSSNRVRQQWQVYANTVNASVPLRHGNSSSCFDFEAIGIEKTMDASEIAWEYV